MFFFPGTRPLLSKPHPIFLLFDEQKRAHLCCGAKYNVCPLRFSSDQVEHTHLTFATFLMCVCVFVFSRMRMKTGELVWRVYQVSSLCEVVSVQVCPLTIKELACSWYHQSEAITCSGNCIEQCCVDYCTLRSKECVHCALKSNCMH